MKWIVWIGMANVAVSSVACVPDLQTADPPCSGKSISYDQAPASFKTSELEDALLQYEALTGRWEADIVCPPDKPPARTLDFVVEAGPRSETRFSTGCGDAGQAATSCQVSLTSKDFPDLNGQSAKLDVEFLVGPYKVRATQLLDPSYDPSVDFISMGVQIDLKNAVSGWVTYGFHPFRDSDGTKVQYGYDCDWTEPRKLAP